MAKIGTSIVVIILTATALATPVWKLDNFSNNLCEISEIGSDRLLYSAGCFPNSPDVDYDSVLDLTCLKPNDYSPWGYPRLAVTGSSTLQDASRTRRTWITTRFST